MTQLIGWREWLSLPDLGIARIKAKIDTGARTSCLHAHHLEPFTEQGSPWVRIWVHPRQNSNHSICCAAPIVDERVVTDSGGHRERRIVIQTTVVLGTKTVPIEMTLTNRDTMKFRMLLGRSALAGQFIVDPQTSYLAGKIK
ncbi:ATP-dependent zinc protease family protein [Porticoccus sp.]|uniref:ATP-dependent zinc protease family protein n=1 Tax=Porticoccus sp. TaxID=2024853 RepID=UPI003F69E8C4